MWTHQIYSIDQIASIELLLTHLWPDERLQKKFYRIWYHLWGFFAATKMCLVWHAEKWCQVGNWMIELISTTCAMDTSRAVHTHCYCCCLQNQRCGRQLQIHLCCISWRNPLSSSNRQRNYCPARCEMSRERRLLFLRAVRSQVLLRSLKFNLEFQSRL